MSTARRARVTTVTRDSDDTDRARPAVGQSGWRRRQLRRRDEVPLPRAAAGAARSAPADARVELEGPGRRRHSPRSCATTASFWRPTATSAARTRGFSGCCTSSGASRADHAGRTVRRRRAAAARRLQEAMLAGIARRRPRAASATTARRRRRPARALPWLYATQLLDGSGPNQRGKYKSAYMLEPFPSDQIDDDVASSDAAGTPTRKALVQVDSYGCQVNAVARGDRGAAALVDHEAPVPDLLDRSGRRRGQPRAGSTTSTRRCTARTGPCPTAHGRLLRQLSRRRPPRLAAPVLQGSYEAFSASSSAGIRQRLSPPPVDRAAPRADLSAMVVEDTTIVL